MSRVAIDLTGQRFGRLLVARRAGTYTNGSALWDCKCDCGRSRNVASQALLMSRTRSCGCLRRQRFIDNMAAGRAQAAARSRRAGIVFDTGPDLEPLIAAARAWWARYGAAA